MPSNVSRTRGLGEGRKTGDETRSRALNEDASAYKVIRIK